MELPVKLKGAKAESDLMIATDGRFFDNIGGS